MQRNLSPRGAAQRATDAHLSGLGASQAGGRLESGRARRRGGRCLPGNEQRPPTTPPGDRQHEQAGRINKWVPFGLPRGSGAQPRTRELGGLGGPTASAAAPSPGEVLQRRVRFGPAPCGDRESERFAGRKAQFRYLWTSWFHPLSGRVEKLGPMQHTSPTSSLH